MANTPAPGNGNRSRRPRPKGGKPLPAASQQRAISTHAVPTVAFPLDRSTRAQIHFGKKAAGDFEMGKAMMRVGSAEVPVLKLTRVSIYPQFKGKGVEKNVLSEVVQRMKRNIRSNPSAFGGFYGVILSIAAENQTLIQAAKRVGFSEREKNQREVTMEYVFQHDIRTSHEKSGNSRKIILRDESGKELGEITYERQTITEKERNAQRPKKKIHIMDIIARTEVKGIGKTLLRTLMQHAEQLHRRGYCDMLTCEVDSENEKMIHLLNISGFERLRKTTPLGAPGDDVLVHFRYTFN